MKCVELLGVGLVFGFVVVCSYIGNLFTTT